MAYGSESRNPNLVQYIASDLNTKSVLRYFSKTTSHKNELEKKLRKRGFILTLISEDEIEAEKIGHRTDKDFESCVKSFLANFSAWNEKFEECSKADEIHIISLLKKYKTECFGNWYKDSSTFLVIGPKHIVDEIKSLVLDRFKGRLTNGSMLKTVAESFDYDEVSPPVMRFVMKQNQYKNDMKAKMRSVGNVEIKTKEKLLTVEVTPNMYSKGWPHVVFKDRSKKVLENFFNQFDSWKENFDPIQIAMSSDVFHNESHLTHYIQWHGDTGTVIAVGIRRFVEEYEKRCLSILVGRQTKPNSQRLVSAMSVTRSPRTVSPSELLSTRSKSTPSRTRTLSANDPIYTQSASAEGNTILFDEADQIPPAVLKFVNSDDKAHIGLGKCCGKNVKIGIKSDKGQINIHITFRRQAYGSQARKGPIFDGIKQYFSKFATKNVKCDREKLEKILKSSPEVFDAEPGSVFISHYTSTGTVKITGLLDKVNEKEQLIKYELSAEVEEEMLPADIFIAQRECGVWMRVEELCKASGFRVSITSPEPGIIQYKGQYAAIIQAKRILGTHANNLFKHEVQGLSDAQSEFLQKYGALQKEFVKKKENKLDALYEMFKHNLGKGAVVVQSSSILLICASSSDWRKTNAILISAIVNFEVQLNRGKKQDIPTAKIYKTLKTELEESMVLLKQQDSKKAIVYCLKSQMTAIKQRVEGILNEISEIAQVKKFYPMQTKNVATHIFNMCKSKIREANSVELIEKDGTWGLTATCEIESLDIVDISFEDLKVEIVRFQKAIAGYSLHEWLAKNELHFKIGRETNCSIFLLPNKKAETTTQIFTVKVGDILKEKCDALVNSTGSGCQFSSNQVSQALEWSYGGNILEKIASRGQTWIVNSQACLYLTCSPLPWKYIINICTPSTENELKNFLNILLRQADAYGITSLAMPTIGTGNMGMDPVTVAKCMKRAFRSFSSNPLSNLKDVRVVVYESSLYSVFKDIIPQKAEPQSTGVTVDLYGNSLDDVAQAVAGLEKIIKDNLKIAVIEGASICEFTEYIKGQASEICSNHRVQLKWTKNGGRTQERCCLDGVAEYVDKAMEDIKKLLDSDFPSSWSPMVHDHAFEKFALKVGSDEYEQVKATFQESNPRFLQIIKIERIQNSFLYKQFKTKKDIKKTENSASIVTRTLFHGTTTDKVEKICGAGFDRNFAGENGTVFGKGVYFAVESSYSAEYTNESGEKCIFLAEVITGDYTQGSPEYKAPPVKANGDLYDSVVDSMHNPEIFVVFRDASVYPHYLIRFM